jgi:hypothetical protein
MVQRARKGLKGWAYPIIMAVMATGIVIEAFLLVPVVQRQSELSQAGADARQRQCELAPISEKTYRWFHASGVITWEELQKFRAGAPSKAECAELLAR